MLVITVPGHDYWDEENEKFVTVGDFVLELEHSLANLSKWEQVFERPFLVPGEKTPEEAMGYIKAMVMTPNVPPDVFDRLTEENISQINAYIEAKASGTWFSENMSGRRSTETLTSELIYYWMDMFGIKIEAQDWHLNRLFNLIRIHNAKQQKPKKMSPADRARWQRELNEKRKAEMGTRG